MARPDERVRVVFMEEISMAKHPIQRRAVMVTVAHERQVARETSREERVEELLRDLAEVGSDQSLERGDVAMVAQIEDLIRRARDLTRADAAPMVDS